jgi:hypothetical protein
MKQSLSLCPLLALALAAAVPASAQVVEITPFAGYQFGGDLEEISADNVERELEPSPTWGLMLDFSVTAFDQVEVYFSSQGTELDRGTEPAVSVQVDTFQVGAIHQYAPGKPVNPYLGLTLGATRYGVGGSSDTRFSGALALGIKLMVSDHYGFRFDGRFFGSSTSSGEISCADELCVGYPDTSVIWQYAVNAGVIIKLGG